MADQKGFESDIFKRINQEVNKDNPAFLKPRSQAPKMPSPSSGDAVQGWLDDLKKQDGQITAKNFTEAQKTASTSASKILGGD